MSQEIETIDDVEKEELGDISEPYDVSKIDILNEPEYVDRMIKKYDNKELILNPDFQRNEVWNDKQKSRLIESILIKIPIPSFYIDARDESRWIVIDGLQRLSSIIKFVKNKYPLKHLEFLKELEGKYYKDLDRNYQRRIEDYKLTLYLVRPNTPEEIALNIFTRINTLGSPLSPQELRHAIYNGKSTDLLKEVANSNIFKKVVSPTSAMRKRMADRELILRFLAFKIHKYENYPKSNNLSVFLANTMKIINNIKDEEINKLKYYVYNALEKTYMVFNKYSYRKIYLNDDKKRPINKSLFETINYFIVDYSDEYLISNKKVIEKNLRDLLTNDKTFELSISRSTNNYDNVMYRFDKIKNIFKA